METIQIKNTSLKHCQNFFTDNFNIENLYDAEALFEEVDLNNPPSNFISNKRDLSQRALWFGPVAYKYGRYRTLLPKEMPSFVAHIAREIERDCGYENGFLNSVYINRYENAGIGKHHDNDDIFKTDKSWNGGKEIIVAVYSIGGDSKISLYEGYNGPKVGEYVAIDNSVYVMNENFQNTLYHQVGNSKGTRISFTFRHCV